MKTMLFILTLTAILFFTNPSVEKHKMMVNRQCKELNPITGFVGGCGLYSQLGLEYHNLYVCSVTLPAMCNSGSNKQPVSIGVLGIIFIVQNLNI